MNSNLMHFEEINSSYTQNCENCAELSKKIDSLQESISNLNKIVQQQNETIMKALADIKVVATKSVRQETSITVTPENCFPLTSDENLEDLDEKIRVDNEDIYVSAMIKLWKNSVGKNLELILDRRIVMRYNIDGTHGKLRLRKYENFFKALLKSIASLPSTEQKNPETVLRQAMQLCKKKQFRQQAMNKSFLKVEAN